MRERGCNRVADCSKSGAIQEVKLRTKKLKTTRKEKSQSSQEMECGALKSPLKVPEVV